MRLSYDLSCEPSSRPAYVTVGVFDGVHLGHRRLITDMVKAARQEGAMPLAVTFDPHPALALGYVVPPLLTTIEERAALIADLGVEQLFVLPFTQDLAHTSAHDFVGRLRGCLGMVGLWVGRDFSMGKHREGYVHALQQLGEALDFTLHSVEPVCWGGAVVSSSRIRAALREGDVTQAAGCLGQAYRLSGVVVHGDGRGHKIGVPTANVFPPPKRLVPGGGIYACLAHTARLGTYPAAVSIGTRPTFVEASGGVAVEAHLLGFDADIYDQSLVLDFVARLRDEWTFPDIDALVAQIDKDIAQVVDLLGDG